MSAQLQNFIEGLDLDDSKHSYQKAGKFVIPKMTENFELDEAGMGDMGIDARGDSPRGGGGEEEKKNEDTGYISNKSLVSFSSEVNGQNREDLLDSLLLGQLAASKKFSSTTETDKWFEVFSNVMNTIGWVMSGKEVKTYTAKGGSLEVQSAVLDIISTALGAGAMAIAKNILNGLKSLENKDDKKFIAFEKNTHSNTAGSFLLGIAGEKNGAVCFDICMILLTSQDEIKQILFFKSKKEMTTLKYGTLAGTLNVKLYKDARPLVLSKLGSLRGELISDFEI